MVGHTNVDSLTLTRARASRGLGSGAAVTEDAMEEATEGTVHVPVPASDMSSAPTRPDAAPGGVPLPDVFVTGWYGTSGKRPWPRLACWIAAAPAADAGNAEDNFGVPNPRPVKDGV